MTYYRWEHKNYKNDDLKQKIIQLCKDNQYIYGYRKITTLINQLSSVAVNHKRIQRIMQKNDLNCRVRPKKTKSIGKPCYKTDNLLQRQFKASQPMEVLTTNITYLSFGNPMLYLSSIMDLYNGEIVAYKIDNKQDQSLVNDTLNQIVIDIVENYIKNYNNNRIQKN